MTKKEHSLADKILLAIKDMADVFYDGLPKDQPLYNLLDGHNDHSIACTLNRLKREKLVEEVKIDGKGVYKLTPKGKLKIFHSYVIKKPKWDGKWRIVIFDIPETMKKKRELFRSKLKVIGFKMVQNSVWISPYDTQGVVKLLSDSYGLDTHIHFLVVDSISREKKFLDEFKIDI